MNLDIFKKIFGKELVEKALKELSDIKNEWNRRHTLHFKDHKTIAELLGEVLKRLDEIEKKIEKK